MRLEFIFCIWNRSDDDEWRHFAIFDKLMQKFEHKTEYSIRKMRWNRQLMTDTKQTLNPFHNQAKSEDNKLHKHSGAKSNLECDPTYNNESSQVKPMIFIISGYCVCAPVFYLFGNLKTSTQLENTRATHSKCM